MAGADRRESTGIDRNANARLSFQPQHVDDYDLEAMGISDGFRPSGTGQSGVTGHNRMSSQVSQQNNIPGRRTPPPRPSSTTKPGIESFALRNDGAIGTSMRRNSIGAASLAAPTRSSSVSTEMAFVRLESPYQGPAGPSHPYQMYPQESRLARTASVATTSTVQVPDRPYNGPGGPAHPYGMYPQNIVEGETAEESEPVPVIPAGFPGSNNNYQRRLGPDGEEIADIIGPDGHTEQLPPYTKYPDEAFARKNRPNLVLPAGAGGIGLATRNPEFSSREDLNSPQSRLSTRSMTSDSSGSNHQINRAAVEESEKPQLKRWQQVAKRKVCGIIPLWAILLTVAVFILFGIILGTVLAILKPKHPPRRGHFGGGPQSIVYTTMTTTFDATPLTTAPSSLPTLPTGTYALPITIPSTIQNSCILNTQMSAAWTCTVPWTSYAITISPVQGDGSNPLANMEANLSLGNNTFGNYYAFGTQPPVLTNTQVLNLVTDTQDPNRGPAWFFELPYNKLVIVPEALLSPSNTKRDYPGGPSRDGKNKQDDGIDDNDKGRSRHSASDFGNRRGVAEPGDRPWFCYWNGTLLEAFIYVNLTSSAGQRQSFSSSDTATPTLTSPPSNAATSTYGSSVPTSGVQNSPSSGPSQPNFFPPAYPKVLKLEERRIPRGDQSIPPYCIQHVIDPQGVASPLMNSTGQPTTIYLNETEPSIVSQIQGRKAYSLEKDDSEVVEKRDGEMAERQTGGSCGCVWLWT